MTKRATTLAELDSRSHVANTWYGFGVLRGVGLEDVVPIDPPGHMEREQYVRGLRDGRRLPQEPVPDT